MRKTKTRTTVPLKSKLKKDPGVPRLPEVKGRHADLRIAKSKHNVDASMATDMTALAMLASGQPSSTSAHPGDEEDTFAGSSTAGATTKEQLRRHHVRTLHKVIDQSDVVVLVLDARDPEGCRSRLVEEEVRRRESEGKKLVFVLNKIDLVPRPNAEAWLRYLRHSTPTLPFRSAPSNQRDHLPSTSASVSLLRLIKAYKPSAAQSITVGIVGFPNVGKSSLINTLKRSKVCAVAAQPGHTRDLQSIQLERGIKIVDSPGVVFDEEEDDGRGAGTSRGSILLRNVIKVEDVVDPTAAVEEIVARTAGQMLQKIYNLPPFTSTIEFLTMLALNSGRLLKGGTPDILATARTVLQDWNQQKIPYFCSPPAVHPSSVLELLPAPGAERVGQAQIVTELGKPFELAGLFGAADSGAFGDDADDDAAIVREDAVMQDGVEKMDEDSSLDIPLDRGLLKRGRSPSPSLSLLPNDRVQQRPQANAARRPPKRLRRLKAAEDAAVPSTHERMAHLNPMSRRALKKEAKKARRRAGKNLGGEDGVQMDIDRGLEFTFMA